MRTKIQKWGNSHAVRIPVTLLKHTEIKENDVIDIKVERGDIVISPIKKRRTLKERIENYKGDYKCSEWQTGTGKGEEVS
ncbi:MAG: AbrB/MazE/SpoVT family DNA-binding domain-containing protein [Alkaliphilus sp.]